MESPELDKLPEYERSVKFLNRLDELLRSVDFGELITAPAANVRSALRKDRSEELEALWMRMVNCAVRNNSVQQEIARRKAQGQERLPQDLADVWVVVQSDAETVLLEYCAWVRSSLMSTLTTRMPAESVKLAEDLGILMVPGMKKLP